MNTRTKIGGSIEPPIFFYFLAKSLEISRFRDIEIRHILPFLLGRMCLFFRNDDMLDHTCCFLGENSGNFRYAKGGNRELRLPPFYPIYNLIITLFYFASPINIVPHIIYTIEI